MERSFTHVADDLVAGIGLIRDAALAPLKAWRAFDQYAGSSG